MPTGRTGWIQEFVAIGILAAGVGGGWLMADNDLAWELHQSLATNTVASFDAAKRSIFNDVDVLPGNRICCRYSATEVALVEENGVLKPLGTAGVQVEHTWPSRANWTHDADKFERDSIAGADLHHLFPARRGLNASRGNHPFGELPDTARELRIDADDGTLADDGEGLPSGSFRDEKNGEIVFEPRAEHKGDAARAMFYMSVRYWMPIPEEMENDLRNWHSGDPADDQEITRNDRVEAIQHNRNPFADLPDLVAQISDF
jgi:endonuclease I